MAANQKRRIGKMWTMFEGDRHVSKSGWWDTSQRIVEGKQEGTAETEGRDTQRVGRDDERLRQI